MANPNTKGKLYRLFTREWVSSRRVENSQESADLRVDRKSLIERNKDRNVCLARKMFVHTAHRHLGMSVKEIGATLQRSIGAVRDAIVSARILMANDDHLRAEIETIRDELNGKGISNAERRLQLRYVAIQKLLESASAEPQPAEPIPKEPGTSKHRFCLNCGIKFVTEGEHFLCPVHRAGDGLSNQYDCL